MEGLTTVIRCLFAVIVFVLSAPDVHGLDGELIVESFIVADRKCLEIYLLEENNDEEKAKASLREDIEFFLTIANEFYLSLGSYGLNIKLAITDIQILDKDLVKKIRIKKGKVVNEKKMLIAFEKFLKSDEALLKKSEYDFALFLTGYRFSNGVEGLANQNQICTESAVAISEMSGVINNAHTFAHEVAHVLGAGNDHGGQPYLIPETAQYTFDPLWYIFSKQSAENISDTLKNPIKIECLKGKQSRNSRIPNTTTEKYKGKIQDPNTTCIREFGPQSTVCTSSQFYDDAVDSVSGDAVCWQIHCRLPSGQCKAARTPDGMGCAKGKSCRKGRCEDDSRPAMAKLNNECLFGDDPAPFGDERTCTSYLDDVGAEGCGRKVNSTACCQSCVKYQTGDPDCPLKYQKLQWTNNKMMTCEDIAEEYGLATLCSGHEEFCCAVCKKTGPDNCPYGQDKLIDVGNRDPITCEEGLDIYGKDSMCKKWSNKCCEMC